MCLFVCLISFVVLFFLSLNFFVKFRVGVGKAAYKVKLRDGQGEVSGPLRTKRKKT